MKKTYDVTVKTTVEFDGNSEELTILGVEVPVPTEHQGYAEVYDEWFELLTSIFLGLLNLFTAVSEYLEFNWILPILTWIGSPAVDDAERCEHIANSVVAIVTLGVILVVSQIASHRASRGATGAVSGCIHELVEGYKKDTAQFGCIVTVFVQLLTNLYPYMDSADRIIIFVPCLALSLAYAWIIVRNIRKGLSKNH